MRAAAVVLGGALRRPRPALNQRVHASDQAPAKSAKAINLTVDDRPIAREGKFGTIVLRARW